jgi:hypothetical protein
LYSEKNELPKNETTRRRRLFGWLKKIIELRRRNRIHPQDVARRVYLPAAHEEPIIWRRWGVLLDLDEQEAKAIWGSDHNPLETGSRKKAGYVIDEVSVRFYLHIRLCLLNFA